MKSCSVVTIALAAALAWPAASSAFCIRQMAQQQRDAAAVVFVGVALGGPTASGVQRFRVEQYEKGAGPEIRLVSTGVVARADGSGSTTSVSVEAAAGERWRIYGMPGPAGVLETNVCAGTTKLPTGVPVRAGSDSAPSAPDDSAAAGGGDHRGLALAALVLGLTLSAGLLVALGRRRVTRIGD